MRQGRDEETETDANISAGPTHTPCPSGPSFMGQVVPYLSSGPCPASTLAPLQGPGKGPDGRGSSLGWSPPVLGRSCSEFLAEPGCRWSGNGPWWPGVASCVIGQALTIESQELETRGGQGLQRGVYGGLVHWPLLLISSPRQANLEPRVQLESRTSVRAAEVATKGGLEESPPKLWPRLMTKQVLPHPHILAPLIN